LLAVRKPVVGLVSLQLCNTGLRIAWLLPWNYRACCRGCSTRSFRGLRLSEILRFRIDPASRRAASAVLSPAGGAHGRLDLVAWICGDPCIGVLACSRKTATSPEEHAPGTGASACVCAGLLGIGQIASVVRVPARSDGRLSARPFSRCLPGRGFGERACFTLCARAVLVARGSLRSARAGS